LSFAGVASTAAQGDVFKGDDGFIIDDVFPTGSRALGHFGGCERLSAVHTHGVSGSDLLLESGGDVPVVRQFMPKNRSQLFLMGLNQLPKICR
jgi:hypothetical protein